VDLQAVAADHIARLRQAAAKRRVPFEAAAGARIAAPADVESTCFEWRGDFHALNLLAYCAACRRVTLVRVLARPGERLKPVAARVFESFRDHGRDGVTPWAVYGLRLDAPDGFDLADSALTLQRVELTFRSGDEELAGGRSNLAEMQLRGRSLEQWLRAGYGREIGRFAPRFEAETYRGHPAARFTGVPRGPSLSRLVGRGREMLGRVWRCEDTDKLFVARWTGRPAGRGRFEPFCDAVRCHGEAGD
jgi:hypothetical protein